MESKQDSERIESHILVTLQVWGCQCFVAIPPELWTKGGPRRFEAIFVGYEENRLGWHVRDLNGKYHFSHDIIFNELVPGCLSPSSSSSSPSSSSSSSLFPPPPHPTHVLTCLAKGQAFADAIQIWDNCLAANRECHGFTNPYGLRSQVGMGWHFRTPVKPIPTSQVSRVGHGCDVSSAEQLSTTTTNSSPLPLTTTTSRNLCSTAYNHHGTC